MVLAAHVLALAFRLVVALAGRGRARGPRGAGVPRGGLPAYTVMGPLHREAGRVGTWLDAVAALRYPRELLDVQLLLEEDDLPTRRAAERHLRRLGDPPWARAIVVPRGGPRTKPNALMRGLEAARGELLVVYDAEDAPDPGQLLAAAELFSEQPPEVVCLQARPVITAAHGARGRLMAAEYRVWHGGFLPGLARLGAPVPLAGTSNHLRVGALRALGGWDPGNVTEDAELGVRLARAGLRTAMLDSPTSEDSTPEGLAAWVRQRSRWSQGFAQTWLAVAWPPGRLARELGVGRAACVHATLAGTLAIQLTEPALWCRAAAGPAVRAARTGRARPSRAEAACLAGLVAGSIARLAACRAFRAGGPGLGAAGLRAPGYWLLEGLAAWRGMHGLIRHPHRWEKTEHPPRASEGPRGSGPDGRFAGGRRGYPTGDRKEAEMDVNPIELQKYLKGVDYPTDAGSLASTAEDNGAPAEIVDQLRGLSGEVSGPDQVMKKLA